MNDQSRYTCGECGHYHEGDMNDFLKHVCKKDIDKEVEDIKKMKVKGVT